LRPVIIPFFFPSAVKLPAQCGSQPIPSPIGSQFHFGLLHQLPSKILLEFPHAAAERRRFPQSKNRKKSRKEKRGVSFMGLSVSNSLSIASQPAANLSSAAAPRPSAAQATTNNQQDTVKLSSAQQVEQLYNQGQSVPEISTSLSLAQSVVNLYLGIAGSGSST
jgi:hypothetical protein